MGDRPELVAKPSDIASLPSEADHPVMGDDPVVVVDRFVRP